MRTTSSVESLNSQLSRSFAKHAHVFKFIDSLKYHEFDKTLIMFKLAKTSALPKGQLERRRKKDKERDEKIKYFSDLLKDGSISVGEFLESMANKRIVLLMGNILILYVFIQ